MTPSRPTLLPLLALGLWACSTPAPVDGVTTSAISVTYCDKAENTQLVRVGIGGENNIGEVEPTTIACEDNGKPLGCTFAGVKPGTYRVEDGLWSAIVYAGPLPSPAGDAHVEMACQKACVEQVTVTSDGCGDAGKMRVYTADPAPIATSLGEYPWTAGSPTKIGPSTCAPLVAEVDTPSCGTLVAGIHPTGIHTDVKLALSAPQVVELTVQDPAGKPIAGAYVADDTFRTGRTDADGKLTLRRMKGAASTIWVQANGFAGTLYPVPVIPTGDGAAPPEPQTLAMPVVLEPTHPVTVTCRQGEKPCAGPVVVVGKGMAARGCDARSASEWTCLAGPDDEVWARQGTTVSPRVKGAGAAVAVRMP